MREEALLFGRYQSLVGVLTHPTKPASRKLPAVLFLNAGMIHRMGPSRIYVKLARCLSELGFHVLRFDMSGIGDSRVRQDNLPFEKSTIDDIQQAMDHLSQTVGAETFILMGHCAGAINSFRTAAEDDRVIGAVLLNPEGGNADWDEYDQKRKSANFYQHYYSTAVITSRERWIKLLTGKADYRSIFRNVFQTIIWNRVSAFGFRIKDKFIKDRTADPVTQQTINGLNAITSRHARLLFIYPEGSTGLARLQSLVGAKLNRMVDTGQIELTIMPDCDHNYTLLAMQDALWHVVHDWIQSIVGATTEPAAVREKIAQP